MAEGAPTGLLVAGSFKGVKEPAPYEVDGRTGMSQPRIGVEDAEGTVHSVVVTGETFLAWKDKERGSRIVLAVVARAPFRQGQPVRLLEPGAVRETGGWE